MNQIYLLICSVALIVVKADNNRSLSSICIPNCTATSTLNDVNGQWSLIVKFILSKQNVKSITPNSFYSMSCLTDLDLSQNAIESLSETFVNLEKLRVLNLSMNELETIHRNTFENLKQLKILDLSRNRISTLEDHCFKVLPELIELDLSHNNITKLGGNQLALIFGEALKLKLINLSYNNLQFFLAFTVKTLLHLEVLNLAHNKIFIFTVGNVKMPQLTFLDLSNNIIEYMDPEGMRKTFSNVNFTLDLNTNQFSCGGLSYILSTFRNLGVNYAKGRDFKAPKHISNISCEGGRQLSTINILMSVIFVAVVIFLILCVDYTLGLGYCRTCLCRFRRPFSFAR